MYQAAGGAKMSRTTDGTDEKLPNIEHASPLAALLPVMLAIFISGYSSAQPALADYGDIRKACQAINSVSFEQLVGEFKNQKTLEQTLHSCGHPEATNSTAPVSSISLSGWHSHKLGKDRDMHHGGVAEQAGALHKVAISVDEAVGETRYDYDDRNRLDFPKGLRGR